jgi:ABC-type sugar transport system ATPase subunit
MTIKKGEIIGVTGLMGAGKTELGRAISGVDKLDGGRLYPGKEGALPDTSGRYS